jgi:hypothetical protein
MRDIPNIATFPCRPDHDRLPVASSRGRTRRFAIVQPVKLRFVLNLQMARALGIEVPPQLLAIIDEVMSKLPPDQHRSNMQDTHKQGGPT